MGFSLSDIPSLAGKVAIITGANAGLGRVSTLELARKGCHVIMACRNKERTQPVIEEIKKDLPSAQLDFLELDLNSLSSITRFAEAFRAKNLPLHILLNNAGTSLSSFTLTQDGLEAHFGGMVIGHAYLTLLLLDILEQSAPSRVVLVSSMMHKYPYSEGIRFDRLHSPEGFSETGAYGQAKLAINLFGRFLAKRLVEKGVYVNMVHPGWVATDMKRDDPGLKAKTIRFLSSMFALSVEKGALTQLFVATSPAVEEKKISGRYFVPTAQEAQPSALSLDDELAQKLWEYVISTLKEKVPGFVSPV